MRYTSFTVVLVAIFISVMSATRLPNNQQNSNRVTCTQGAASMECTQSVQAASISESVASNTYLEEKKESDT